MKLFELFLLVNDTEALNAYLLGVGIGAAPLCNQCNRTIFRRKDKVNYFRCSI
jgi:hypothetical protein